MQICEDVGSVEIAGTFCIYGDECIICGDSAYTALKQLGAANINWPTINFETYALVGKGVSGTGGCIYSTLELSCVTEKCDSALISVRINEVDRGKSDKLVLNTVWLIIPKELVEIGVDA